MYQGMMTFVLMPKEPGTGLLANTKGSCLPLWCGHPWLQTAGTVRGSTHTLQAHAGISFPNSVSFNEVLSYTCEAAE